MITFICSIVLLVLGYVFYGKYLQNLFGVDPSRPTPAITKRDNVDYMPLPTWKVFVIQFLNIAGLGPIFGAVTGAAYGPMAYIWIVVGCIFMGAVHDFFSGAISLRHNGKQMNEVTQIYQGRSWSTVMLVIIAFLLLAIGVSFIVGPADLLVQITSLSKSVWIWIIIVYYLLATLLPIDKIIGKIYPFFGALLLFMAVAVGGVMVYKSMSGDLQMTELTLNSFRNFHYNPKDNLLIPMLFVVISCGAISGFHSTQSPLMARCLGNEKNLRFAFYGAMIAEGIVALIWANAAISYFGGVVRYNQLVLHEGMSPAIAVNAICKSWLGKAGAIIAILGVVVCPLTTGDTSLRSLRMIIADFLKLDQKPMINRLKICIPIFIIVFFFCKVDFSTVWKYVGILNQLLACLVLWTITSYLIHEKKNYWVAAIPATLLTFVVVCYFIVAPIKAGGLHLNSVVPNLGYWLGIVVSLAMAVFFIVRSKRKCRLYNK